MSLDSQDSGSLNFEFEGAAQCTPSYVEILMKIQREHHKINTLKFAEASALILVQSQHAELDGMELRRLLLLELGGIVSPIPFGLTLVFTHFLMGGGLGFTERETPKRSTMSLLFIMSLILFSSISPLFLGAWGKKSREKPRAFLCQSTDSQTFLSTAAQMK